ncbi:hypothetical protein BD626DRAFT_504051 [Schizophyllum amplum]|uniref:Uncharacterized protein n=1 Tax=Schizophyllum amplum TaxID=97359 RepID=A0A550C7Q0_9AGAR|nr:hypothetical protein BD626DRAFT_504051 [Auriculariopsis ampla]
MVFKQNPSRSRRANTVPSQEGPPSSSSATISSNRHVQPPSGGQKSAFASFQGLDVSTPSLRGPPQAQAQRSLTQHLPGPATVSAGPVYLTAANSNHLMANAGVQGQMPYLGAQTYGGPYSGYATGANLNVPSLAHNTSVTATPNSGLPAHYHNGGGYNGVGQFTPYSHNAHGYNAQASGASRGVVSYPVGNVPQSFAPAPPALAPPTHQLQAPATSFDFGQSTYSTTPSSSTVAPSFGATSSSTAPSSTTASQYYYPYTDYGVYGSGPR